MHSFWKSGKILILSVVMFGAGASAATIALSYLPSVTAAPKIVTQGLKQNSKTVVTDEERQFKFELQGCKRGNQKVTCNILITNLANKNKTIEFAASGVATQQSRLIDDSGNEYVAQNVKIGSQERSSSLQTELIAGIPTKVILTFEIPQQISKFAVLEAYIAAYGYSDGTAALKPEFRDVNFSGSQASNPRDNCTCPQTSSKKTARPR
ncbi:MAG: hypothetical protein ACHBN1_29890 [Heteroscytonema crispum UTEX LB 1556]